MAAAAAYRVEVPVLGFVDLLAEAGVGGVLATGASLATSPSGHLGVLGLGSGEGGGVVMVMLFSPNRAWVHCWFGPLSPVGVRKLQVVMVRQMWSQ